MERKLAAILAADVVGYSKAMTEDEEGTLQQLQAHRTDLFNPIVAENNGRIIKLMGDGTLVEFASVVDAVKCAADVQSALSEDDGKIRLRIGVNLGDVIVEGDDIYGDGVNIAARLEGLAQAGDVLVSRTVADHVKGKVTADFEDLGERKLKNIAEPVQAFRLVLPHHDVLPSAEIARAKPPARFALLAVGIAALVLVIGVLAWQRPWEPHNEPASAERMAFALPDKPSIAVLPFANFSEDANQEYFADGITEDIITDLAKISSLFVIARNSSFSFKGKQVKVRQVAEELGVRYVLEGSVRRAGEKVRINAQLIDATTGGHLWAERYDGSNADIFELQDKVTGKIVNALALSLTPQEISNVSSGKTGNPAAHDAYLLGLSYYHRRTPSDNAIARTHFEKAIQLDPDYSAAYVALAKVYVRAIAGTEDYAHKLRFEWVTGTSKPWKYLQKAKSRPDKDYFLIRSRLALKGHQPHRAASLAKRALELSSNDAEVKEALAEALIFSGQPEAGLKNARDAIRQNPTQIGRPNYLIGLAQFSLGDARAAVDSLNRAIEQIPDDIGYYFVLAAAHGDLGEAEKAKSAFLKARQRFDWAWPLHQIMASYPFSNVAVLDRFAHGLKTAGVPVRSGEFLRLHAGNRLSGPDLRSLLFGAQIQGVHFWLESNVLRWKQIRSNDGSVQHLRGSIQPGVVDGDTGIGKIEDDVLCEVWPKLARDLEICVVVFRVVERIRRIKWGDYVMVTATGPHPFSLVRSQ